MGGHTVVSVGTHDAPAKISAHYHITGNWSAVVETLSNGMTSVYYPDGADLKMTHFCAAQNQPRLKVTEFSPDLSKIAFSFVDITNLTSPSAGHVVGFEVRFLTSDHITSALSIHNRRQGQLRVS